ncbi:MAG: hypothetical protein NC489_20125 [Ruminococcus flavefaciens]|nr:hypothetical protein [Ruminococcus flavefaciens]
MQSERDIYEWKSKKIEEYHKRQLENPYRSTLHFEKFLSGQTSLNGKKILDVACGGGYKVFGKYVQEQ